MAYQLKSQLFTKDPAIRARLQRIAQEDLAHVQFNNKEDCVSTLQEALFQLVPNLNLPDDELAGVYGRKTEDAVFEFKNTPALNGTGGKIVRAGQRDCDKIVGVQTIEAMDRMLVKKLGASPPTASVKQRDIVIWIQGPSDDSQHGQPDTQNGGMLAALVAQVIEPKKQDYETQFSFPPLVIAVFGAPRGNATNPEAKIKAAVLAVKVPGKMAIGRVFLWGSSLGGINAMHLSGALKRAGAPQELAAFGDAAFSILAHNSEEKTQDGRTVKIFDRPPDLTANSMFNTFQTWGNELTNFLGFTGELHGAVRGIPRHDVSNEPRVKKQVDDWVRAGKPGGDKKNILSAGLHDAAVGLGEDKFKAMLSAGIARF